MEVWRDKCLMGSLRVVRPGELERKIADIVADDQDAEPDSTVHTHLCILLADGDDLELNHPRIRCKMPRPPGEPSNSGRPPKPSPFVSNGSARIRAPSPAGDWGQGWTAPRSVENADSSGDAPRPAESAGTGRRGSFPGTPGATTDGAGELRRNGSWACLSLEVSFSFENLLCGSRICSIMIFSSRFLYVMTEVHCCSCVIMFVVC